MAKLSTIKTLAGFDFSFQPSLDRNRNLALAQLDFIERNEVIHFLGPPGTGKSHLATALGVEAVKAGRSVYFASLADIISALAKAEREGQLRERIRLLGRTSLLIADEIGYLPVIPAGGNLFFQLVNARYERRISTPIGPCPGFTSGTTSHRHQVHGSGPRHDARGTIERLARSASPSTSGAATSPPRPSCARR